jgi:bifunctional DNA-binding transcriptional regulator/antitoxin component of YhaV-PrlF toxin-antitoxin module
MRLRWKLVKGWASAAQLSPARLRKRFGIEEGTVVTAEEREGGVLIRPAVVVPRERYTPERKAEFLLSTVTTKKDYLRAERSEKTRSRF